MKKEKWFFGLLERKVPENEWEAKFLVEKHRLQLLEEAFVLVLAAGLLYIIIINLFASTCEIETEGNISGFIAIKEDLSADSPFDFELEEIGGKIRIKAPCFAWGIYLENYYRGG